MEVKDLLTCKINQEVIDFINADGRSIRVMIESVSKGVAPGEVTRKVKNIKKKISRSGYKFNDDTKKYIKVENKKEESIELKNKHNSEKNSSVVEVVEEIPQEPVVEVTKKYQKSPSKKELLAQLKEYQEKEAAEKAKLEKDSQLFIPSEGYFATAIHESAIRMQKNRVKAMKDFEEKKANGEINPGSKPSDGLFNLGFFTYEEVINQFKKIEDHYYYVKNAYIVDAFINHASIFFKKDNLKVKEYQEKLFEIAQEELEKLAATNSKKKTVTYKISQEAVKELEELKKEFPFFSKQSDLVNLILLTISTEFNMHNEVNEKKDS